MSFFAFQAFINSPTTCNFYAGQAGPGMVHPISVHTQSPLRALSTFFTLPLFR